MNLAGLQLSAYLHNENCPMLLRRRIFAFFRRKFGIFVLKLLSGDKFYFFGELTLDERVFIRNIIFSVKQSAVYPPYGEFQRVKRAFFFLYDLFPIPLIDEYRVNVVGVFITSHGVHVGVKSLSRVECVDVQRVTLPFCKRLHDLGIITDVFYIKIDRALDSVQGIVESGGVSDKQRSGYAGQI